MKLDFILLRLVACLVFKGSLAGNSTTEEHLQQQDVAPELNSTTSRSEAPSSPPAKETATDDSGNTKTVLFNNDDDILQRYAEACTLERGTNLLLAMTLPFIGELVLSLFYFVSPDWLNVVRVKRIVVTCILVVNSILSIYFGWSSPLKWAVLSTYMNCTCLMLYSGVYVSVSRGYFRYMRITNMITEVGDDVQLRKRCNAYINAIGFHFCLSMLSCLISYVVEMFVDYPCGSCDRRYVTFTEVPFFFYLVWVILSCALLLYLNGTAAAASTSIPKTMPDRPFCFCILLILLFVLWFLGLTYLPTKMPYTWIGVQVLFCVFSYRIGVVDAVILNCGSADRKLCHAVC